MTPTAFLKAAAAWDEALITALAEQPELAGTVDRRGRTPLHIISAVCWDDRGREPEEALPLAAALVNAGADVNAAHSFADGGETFPAIPLWYAIARGKNTPLASWLLDHGANPDNYCLWAAIWEDDAELMEYLLAKSPDLNARFHGETPLLYACKLGRWEMVRLLCDAGADPTLPDPSGQTPRDHARKRQAPKDVVAALGVGR